MSVDQNNNTVLWHPVPVDGVLRTTLVGFSRTICLVWLLGCSALLTSMPASAQGWTYYSGNQEGTRYSSLDQINRNNIDNLKNINSKSLSKCIRIQQC